jgi:ABC-2 type transport system permease protein
MGIERIWKIARHEYVTNVRRAGFIFVTLLIPAMGLFALIVAAFFSGQTTRFLSSQFLPRTRTVGVVDESGLYSAIRPDYANRFVAYPDEEAAKSALVSDEIAGYVVIPPDYIDSGKVTIYAKGGLGDATSIDSTTLRSFLVEGLLAGKVDPALVTRASRPANTTLVTLDSKGQPTTNGPFSFVAGFLAPYFLSLFLVISIFTSSGYLLRSVSEEKESRVIEVVLSSVTATELLGGKVIGLGALGLTQVAIWLISAFALTGGMGAVIAGAVIALNPSTFLLAAVYFLLGYLVFGIIMAAAGSLGTNMRESQQIAGLFSFAAAIPYMIGGFLFANPNAPIARVLSFFPLTAPTMMMLRLPLGTIPVEDIVGSIVVLLATIPVVLWAGAKVFRMGLLMYGKRPSVREIIRMLSAA